MPLYEEKLICPLAVHFTQDHIRPTFRDGHDIEATIKEMKTRPGEGDYDVIIEAPFPNIEILRWYQRDTDSKEPNTKHWFTVDNRRLYCLQRIAASLWPARVAAVVEVLYAARGSIFRKNSSLTMGCSVAIQHRYTGFNDKWSWREAVLPLEACAAKTKGALENKQWAAHALVKKDDEKNSIEDLSAAPAPPSMLDLYLQSMTCSSENNIDKKASSIGSEASTRSQSTPRSSTS